MDSSTAIDILRSAMLLAIAIGSPLLLVGLAVGFLVSLFQSVTQIQDQTVSAVPKIIAMLLVLIVCLPWITDHLLEYTRTTYEQIPLMLQPR